MSYYDTPSQTPLQDEVMDVQHSLSQVSLADSASPVSDAEALVCKQSWIECTPLTVVDDSHRTYQERCYRKLPPAVRQRVHEVLRYELRSSRAEIY